MVASLQSGPWQPLPSPHSMSLSEEKTVFHPLNLGHALTVLANSVLDPQSSGLKRTNSVSSFPLGTLTLVNFLQKLQLSCQKPRETRGALIHSPRYVAGGYPVATAGPRVSLLACLGAVEPIDNYRPSQYPIAQKNHPTNA